MKNAYSDLDKVLKHFGYTFDDVIVENVFTTRCLTPDHQVTLLSDPILFVAT